MKPQSIQLKSILWLGTLAMLAFATCAQARVNCSITSSAGFTTFYGALLNITAASATVTCTKTPGGSTTATYQLAVNTGLYSASCAGSKCARFTPPATYINYSTTTTPGPACTSSPWGGTTYIPATAYTTPALVTTGATDVKTYLYYGCVAAGLLPAAHTYTDTLSISFIPGGPAYTNNTTTPVSITAFGTCSLTTSTMAFNYTSFQATAASASANFTVTCSLHMPYTLSLDASGTGYTGSFASPNGTYTDTATNLTYTLTLPTPTAGTGSVQTYTISGSMPASQGGKCNATNCSVTDIHTLTVTY